MNILIDKLPTEVEGLELNTDFRTSILFELLMQDKDISNEDKVALSINLYFNRQPKSYEEMDKMTKAIMWFYSCGNKKKELKESNQREQIVKKEKRKKQIYSFEQDDFLIYSAFMEQYGIDLTEAKLHWWKFKAMFDGLNDDILFSKVMGYRSIDLSKIEDKKQREHYAKLQKHWALIDNRSVEEKESDFANALW